ncbi:hypothetical protein GGR56DRAFT_398495 [Xylariaceae sp. FL0804]|nr:hypothetical protein GGR56DRAFT_398495 [Xylariaceae sp. FL0804]
MARWNADSWPPANEPAHSTLPAGSVGRLNGVRHRLFFSGLVFEMRPSPFLSGRSGIGCHVRIAYRSLAREAVSLDPPRFLLWSGGIRRDLLYLTLETSAGGPRTAAQPQLRHTSTGPYSLFTIRASPNPRRSAAHSGEQRAPIWQLAANFALYFYAEATRSASIAAYLSMRPVGSERIVAAEAEAEAAASSHRRLGPGSCAPNLRVQDCTYIIKSAGNLYRT